MGLYTPTAAAQSSTPECELVAPSGRTLVFGDSLTVEAVVTVPASYQAEEPLFSPDDRQLGADVLWQREDGADTPTTRIRYGIRLYALMPDTLSFGPVTVPVTSPAGHDTTLVSNTLVLPVTSVLAAADSIPQPNRAPMPIAGGGLPSWLIGLLVLVALGLVVLIMLFRKRSSHELQFVPPAPIDELAVFADLKQQALHEHGRLKDLYVQLSAAIRGFIHRNMSFDAMYDTTTEIIMELRRSDYDLAVIDALAALLNEADQVKFAKYVPPYALQASAVDRALEPVRAVIAANERREQARAREQEVHDAASAPREHDEPRPAEPVERSG